jgi:regulatory protein
MSGDPPDGTEDQRDEGRQVARADGRPARREQSPTQRALGLLVRREHSRKELTRKLTSRGLDAGEVEAAVDRLADAGWQNDARFAESLVRSRAGTGYGPVRIRAELATHGLDREAIAQAMDAHEGDWAEAARDLIRRRFGSALADDPAVRRKAADFLLRRGFDMDSVRQATRWEPED